MAKSSAAVFSSPPRSFSSGLESPWDPVRGRPTPAEILRSCIAKIFVTEQEGYEELTRIYARRNKIVKEMEELEGKWETGLLGQWAARGRNWMGESPCGGAGHAGACERGRGMKRGVRL
ncbi:hypothetical protein LTR53_002771 [Teratosphaeriaceae sp. CCFEE 6253]|nr:hypothetical protein LTR53_002771 [Teratosphaeriaceae sp. CCFEE 6253]